MDHDATREQLDLAAAEPGGLERLMAGDTATAQAVAAHLAGCDECSQELVRLQRSVALIRSAVRELPPDDSPGGRPLPGSLGGGTVLPSRREFSPRKDRTVCK